MRRLIVVAWVLLGLAFIVWASIATFASFIRQREVARKVSRLDIEHTLARETSALRLRSLAADTSAERAQFMNFLNLDVVSMVDMIEAAGKTARVTLKLGGAVPENTFTPSSERMKAIGFVVEARGTFPALMRAVQLLENLPAPSSIVRFDLERVPAETEADAGSWRLSAYIRMFTTSDISS